MIGLAFAVAACGDSGTTTTLDSSDLDVDPATIECRKAQIASLRMPYVRWVWWTVGADAESVESLEQDVSDLASVCVDDDVEAVEAVRTRILERASDITADYADATGTEFAEARFVIEDRLAVATDSVVDECAASDRTDAFALDDDVFESELPNIAIGNCMEVTSASENSSSGSTSRGADILSVGTDLLSVADGFSDSVRDCMAEFFESLERRTSSECDPAAEDDASDAETPPTTGAGSSSDTTSPATSQPASSSTVVLETENQIVVRYTDEEGNETIVEQGTTVFDSVYTVTTTCTGKCKTKDNGDENRERIEVENPDKQTKVEVTTHDDGSQYLQTEEWDFTNDEPGSVVGRPISDPTDPVDPTGSTDDTDQAMKEFEDCLFGGGSDCERPHECLECSITEGVDMRYALSESRALIEPDNDDEPLPVTAVDALNHCTCLAQQQLEAGTDPLGVLQGSTCASAEDQLRLECMRDPYGPDDGLRSECQLLLFEDLSAWGERSDPICQIIECAEGYERSVVRVDGRDTCGCVSRDYVDDHVRAVASGACRNIKCASGTQCVCDEGGEEGELGGCTCAAGSYYLPDDVLGGVDGPPRLDDIVPYQSGLGGQ